MSELKNRYEFVILFDVENGNPNGDPDAGNMPRVDVESNLGIVTDVCLKRKIRNYVEIVKQGEEKYNILVKNDQALNTKFTAAYKALDLETGKEGKNKGDVKKAQEYMCENYYDVRTFGFVMSTGKDQCGIVRGPVQLNFAKSVNPIFPQELTITRQALTTEEDMKDKSNTMGKKNIVPYGLYRAEGYVSALLANKTGFDDNDLTLLWEAIENMFEHDHSSLRGKLCMRKLVIFKHQSELGNAPSHKVFESVKIKKLIEGPARQYGDYEVTIDNVPQNVEVEVR
ncbi:MAG TPA: type I-C CRISPR-associated protein Cas7/Csd2 [Eubacteriales bacterium]|nr:type I-C CRISPR-associated protein Cas7/Csd2 [Eubacteriales bacterium]